MKQRAAEILFKYKILILLPLIIIVPLTTATALRPKTPMYQSYGVVWVDQYKPLYQDERLGYTPANSQAQLLNGFLHSRKFARSVLDQTRLSPLLTDPASESAEIRRLWSAAQIFPTSNDFITIVVTMPDPDLAVEVAEGIIVSFQEELRARLEEQGTATLNIYSEQVARAEEALAKSRKDLSTYLQAHPELFRGTEGLNASAAARDVNLARLQSQVSNDEAVFNSALQRYQQSQAFSRAGIEGQQFAFKVVDDPQRPLKPMAESRLGMIKLPFIGMVLGLVFSSGIAAFLVLTNRAVQGPYDVKMALGVPLLGEIPELRRRRVWQRAARDAVRMKLSAPARQAPAAPNGG